MVGKASVQVIFDFLTLLSAKGEASAEIAGGVYVMRNKSKSVNVRNCLDTCGTGGDGMNTLNISTASAILLASRQGIVRAGCVANGVRGRDACE